MCWEFVVKSETAYQAIITWMCIPIVVCFDDVYHFVSGYTEVFIVVKFLLVESVTFGPCGVWVMYVLPRFAECWTFFVVSSPVFV